jgi:hypothetical protein
MDAPEVRSAVDSPLEPKEIRTHGPTPNASFPRAPREEDVAAADAVAESSAERWRFSGGRDSETGAVAGPMVGVPNAHTPVALSSIVRIASIVTGSFRLSSIQRRTRMGLKSNMHPRPARAREESNPPKWCIRLGWRDVVAADDTEESLLTVRTPLVTVTKPRGQ